MSRYHHASTCAHCGGSGRLTVRRPITLLRRRTYTVPCNVVTRAQVDLDRTRAGIRIGWSAFAAVSIAAGFAITPATTLLAAVLR